MLDEFTSSTPRRGFLGRFAAAAMGLGVASLTPEAAEAAVSRAKDPQLKPGSASSPESTAWSSTLRK